MSRRSTLSTKPKPDKVYSEGYQAGRVGRSRSSNPYPHNHSNRHKWDKGWLDGSKGYLDSWYERYGKMRKRG